MLSSFLSFLTYELAGNSLTAAKVFTSLAVFGAVRIEVGYFFPTGILVRGLKVFPETAQFSHLLPHRASAKRR